MLFLVMLELSLVRFLNKKSLTYVKLILWKELNPYRRPNVNIQINYYVQIKNVTFSKWLLRNKRGN